MKHREAYPDQYNHPRAGEWVTTPCGQTFQIERVVNSRFGQLAVDPADPRRAWSLAELRPALGER